MLPKMIKNYLFTALVYNKARSNTGDKNLWIFYLHVYTFDIHIRLNRLYNCSFIFILLVFPSGGAYLNKANTMFRWQNIYSGRWNTPLLKKNSKKAVRSWKYHERIFNAYIIYTKKGLSYFIVMNCVNILYIYS